MTISRLCYAAYLINGNFIKVLRSSQRHSSYMSESYVLLYFLGFVTTTFLLSFALSLTVEKPFLNLEKLFLTERITTTTASSTIKQ